MKTKTESSILALCEHILFHKAVLEMLKSVSTWYLENGDLNDSCPITLRTWNITSYKGLRVELRTLKIAMNHESELHYSLFENFSFVGVYTYICICICVYFSLILLMGKIGMFLSFFDYYYF